MSAVWEINPNPSPPSALPPIPHLSNREAPNHEAAGSLLSLADQTSQAQPVASTSELQASDAAELSQQQPPPDPGAFQCGFCKKSYTRADHLIRHVRSHTQEKPYVCPVCQKGFARPDLVKRHAAAHNENRDSGPSAKKRRITQPPSASRVTQACKACASSKLKCAETKPCRRCQQKGLVCEYSADEQTGSAEGQPSPTASSTPGAHGQVTAPSFLNNQTSATSRQMRRPSWSPTQGMWSYDGTRLAYSQNEEGREVKADMNLSMRGLKSTEDMMIEHHQHHTSTSEAFAHATIGSTLNAPSSCDGVLELEGNFYPGFFRDVGLNQSYPPYMSSSLTPQGFMDYGDGLNSVTDSQDGGDFPNIDPFNTENYQFYFAQTSSPAKPRREDGYQTFSLALGAEAFQKSSLAGWEPTEQDHGYSEEGNLSLPDHVDGNTETRRLCDRRIVKTPLSLSSRDNILSLVLEVCRPESKNRVVSSFPCFEFFDNLIQLFFDRHTLQTDNWLHLPTFCPNDSRPELITAIAGAGAIRTNSSVVQKLGYALQESLRNAIPLRLEENNQRARSIEFNQAYFLQLDVRIWSGGKRKVELAEGLFQPGVTMLRRARRFRRSIGCLIMPLPEDEGAALDKKWRAWAEQEARKRLSFHAFLHDAQSSITLNINPLISYAELSLPLPCVSEVWQAPDAITWKRKRLGREPPQRADPSFPERLPCLPEVLQDMSLLSDYANHVDIQLSRLIVLHALWALIWEHRQLNTVSSNQHGPWSDLVLSSRHREICLAVQNFRMHSCTPPMVPEVRLILECINMHLFMSLDELQLYAGKENRQEALQATRSARDWIESSHSKQAVWHAGQVIRAARSFRLNTLRDFYAIAVYHASLAFWSFGIVSCSMNHDHRMVNRAPSNQSFNTPDLYLDRDETPGLQDWINNHDFRPCLSGNLSGHGRSVSLDDPAEVMSIVRDTLAKNWRQERTPPLVENLCQLMSDLGKASRDVD